MSDHTVRKNSINDSFYELAKVPAKGFSQDVIRSFFGLLLFLTGASFQPEAAPVLPPFDAAFLRLDAREVAALPLASRFEMPMGTELGGLTYNAQPFRTTRHLGDDLNGIGGWNSDQGDSVYASGNGRVVYTGVPSDGWGNMVILAHRVPDKSAPQGYRVMQTVYAHLESVFVKHGETILRGEPLGTVGTAHGKYWAHLHFEIRESLSVYPGMGYSDEPQDRVSPEAFVKKYTRAAEGVLSRAPR
jgi:murein DD-endopeptidase MepM/ murein hydrolase activator NlpD